MTIKPGSEIDCYALCTAQGIEASEESRFPGGAVTRYIHANEIQALTVVDVYGNVSIKSVLEGHTYAGSYVFVCTSAPSIPDENTLTLIF